MKSKEKVIAAMTQLIQLGLDEEKGPREIAEAIFDVYLKPEVMTEKPAHTTSMAEEALLLLEERGEFTNLHTLNRAYQKKHKTEARLYAFTVRELVDKRKVVEHFFPGHRGVFIGLPEWLDAKGKPWQERYPYHKI